MEDNGFFSSLISRSKSSLTQRPAEGTGPPNQGFYNCGVCHLSACFETQKGGHGGTSEEQCIEPNRLEAEPNSTTRPTQGRTVPEAMSTKNAESPKTGLLLQPDG